VYMDDSQVVRLVVGKYYATPEDPEGVAVEVEIGNDPT